MPRTWFEIKNAAAEDAATVSIFDEIGMWGITAADFNRELKAIKAPVINLEINSPGGSVFDGIAIYNMLRGSGKTVNAKVMGVAASIASIILMSADKITMPKNAMVMVHSPMGGVFGTSDEMREMADVLDKIKASLVATYVKRTGKTEEEVSAMLAKDTWMNADEALAAGFADEVIDAVELTAKWDMERVPEAARSAFKPKAAAPAPAPAPAPTPAPTAAPAANVKPVAEQIEALAKESGLEAYVNVLVLKCADVDSAKARIGEITSIKATCGVLKTPTAKVDEFIRAGKTLAEVRTAINDAAVAADKHIDTTRSLKTDNAVDVNSKNIYEKRARDVTAKADASKTNKGQPALIASAVYAKRNQQATGA